MGRYHYQNKWFLNCSLTLATKFWLQNNQNNLSLNWSLIRKIVSNIFLVTKIGPYLGILDPHNNDHIVIMLLRIIAHFSIFIYHISITYCILLLTYRICIVSDSHIVSIIENNLFYNHKYLKHCEEKRKYWKWLK